MEQEVQSAQRLPGATPEPNFFKLWDATGFTKWGLSIGPLGATISPNSKITVSQLGKVPMVYNEKAGALPM